MKIDMTKWKKELFNSEKKAMPILTYPGLPLINKSIQDVVRDGFNQYQLIKAVSDKYPSAAAVGMMDLSVEAEAFGMEVRYSENEIPTVHGRLVTDEDSIKSLQVPDTTQGRLPEYIRACYLSAKTIKRPVLGGVIGPFSLAGRLYGMSEIMTAIRRNPNSIHLLLEKCTELIISYAREIKKAGAQGVIMAEPAAGLLSQPLCQNFSSVYVKKIVQAIQDDSFYVILHNCGQTKHLINSMLFTEAEGYHFGNSVDMEEILPLIPKDKIVCGNIDPVNVFSAGSISLIMKKTSELLEKGMLYPNFILSSGCDIPPGTPLSHIEAFYDTLALYNHYMDQQRKIG